jgi:hypothetical protein
MHPFLDHRPVYHRPLAYTHGLTDLNVLPALGHVHTREILNRRMATNPYWPSIPTKDGSVPNAAFVAQFDMPD